MTIKIMKMSTTVAIIKTKSAFLNNAVVSAAIPAGPVISNSISVRPNDDTFSLNVFNTSFASPDSSPSSNVTLNSKVDSSSEYICFCISSENW